MPVTQTDSANFARLESQARALEDQNRLEDARDAYDRALNFDPSSQSCAEGRARIALQLKEEDAVAHCARALAFHQAHPDRQLRMIETAASELGAGAIPLFESFLRAHPENASAHQTLSELKAEAGHGDSFVDNYLEALAARPDDKSLLFSYWTTLSRSGRLAEALESMDSRRTLLGQDREFLLLEANIANHAGLADRAGAALDQLDDGPDAKLARGQHRLQTGRPAEAAVLLEGVVSTEPANQSAWALLEIAWRLIGHERHEWLVRSEFSRSQDLGLDSSQLTSIASLLRSFHRTSGEPIGQSVRAGTQTPGQLFMRSDPEILLLMNALIGSIRQYLAQLPPRDLSHPLLRHRNSELAFGPSWSVRLTGGGYHAPHFHPGGVLSSACYISVADDFGGDEKPGWLEIGRPPPELKVDLPPLSAFRPEPGRLVLFPSFLFHGTRPFTGGERLSVAFDVLAAG